MISFICRVRNEELTLDTCLESLRAVKVPDYEVIVVLDRCTDRSEEIAEKHAVRNPAVKIFRHTHPLSRAGLETLITPKTSKYSIVNYIAWCFSHARHAWKFHVAADIFLSDQLIAFLNGGGLKAYPFPTRIKLPCLSPEDGTLNCEPYLSNCRVGWGKHVFWEVPIFHPACIEVTVERCLVHMGTLKKPKAYWNEPPWFADEADDDAPEYRERYQAAVDILGPEPIGAARGSNPECAPYERRVYENAEALKARGILLYE